MKTRETQLPTPPDRAPYMKMTVGGTEYWFKLPSLLTISLIAKALNPALIEKIVELGAGVATGRSLAASLADSRESGPDVIYLMGSVIGVAWADPVVQLETVRPSTWNDPEAVASFGGGVFEEMHEAGWTLGQMLPVVAVIWKQFKDTADVEVAVMEKADFFGQQRGTTSTGPSKRSAPSSTRSTGSRSKTSRSRSGSRSSPTTK